MYSGDEIYGALTRTAKPRVAIRALDDDGLRRLLNAIEKLPQEGMPVLIGAMADEEAISRWREKRIVNLTNGKSDESNK